MALVKQRRFGNLTKTTRPFILLFSGGISGLDGKVIFSRFLRNPTLITFPFNSLFLRGISCPDGKVIFSRFLKEKRFHG